MVASGGQRSRFTLSLALVTAAACAGTVPRPVAEPRPAASESGRRESTNGAPAICTHAGATLTPSFADPNLERAVRAALGAGSQEPLTCGKLAHVRELRAPDARISDLRGIESLRNLEILYVYGNNSITDVSPLAALQRLRDVSLARNRIEDLGPLSALAGLTSLDLLGNPVRDLGPLGALEGLQRLRIADSPLVRDLRPLAALDHLAWLELDRNDIEDVTPLAGLASLTRLSLQGNPRLTDIAPLCGLAALETLMLGGTSVTDVSPLASLSRLSTLGLDGTGIADIGPLLGVTSLSRLDLSGNRELTGIEPLLFHTGLGPGDAVRLEWTGVRCDDVGALRRKGVTVFSDCP